MSDGETRLAAKLEDRAHVRVAGAEAHDLLDRLVTADLGGLTPGAPSHHAGLLTPQGKILAEMHVVRPDETTLLIDIAEPLCDDLIKRLQMYRLRAAVEIARTDEPHMTWVIWRAPDDFGTLWSAEDQQAFLAAHAGQRIVVPTATGDAPAMLDGAEIISHDDYHDHRVEIGIGELISDYDPSDRFPHDVNWDVTKTVAFDKGCFIGQEVVSRTRHKAVPRRRLVQLFAPEQDLEPDASVTVGEAELGTLGTIHSNGRLALAIVRIDRVISALDKGQTLTAGAAEIEIDPAATDAYRKAAAA
ncbi:MAG: hypothetical protein AAFV26_10470 [Pseudomonadota bacterium]